MTGAKRARRPSRPTSPLEGLDVLLIDEESLEYEAWLARRRRVEEPASRVLRFATWYPPAFERWLARATEVGVWSVDDRWEAYHEGCRRRDDVVGHHTDADGLKVHLVIDAADGILRLVARYCGRGMPPMPPPRYTDDMHLTFEEFVDGHPCKGCGRGFTGGPEWKPVMYRTPEEQRVFALEEEAYLRLHPDCGGSRWSVNGGGITHCGTCCPRPPLGPEQNRRIATLLVEMAQARAEWEAELARRWQEAEGSLMSS